VQGKMKHLHGIVADNINSTFDNTDASIDQASHATSDSIPSIQLSLEKRRRNQTLNVSSVKKKKV
jgi:hypothetical protein